MPIELGLMLQIISVGIAFVALIFTIVTVSNVAKTRERELEARLTRVESDVKTLSNRMFESHEKMKKYDEYEKAIVIMQQEIQVIKEDIAEIKLTIKEEISAIKHMLEFTKNFK